MLHRKQHRGDDEPHGEGRTYTFAVFAYDSARNYSSTQVTLSGSRVQALTSVTPRVYGASITHRAHLHPYDRLGGQRVSLYRRARGAATWRFACSGTTGTGGYVSCAVPATTNAEYEWRFGGGHNIRASTSLRYAVKVRHKVTAGVSATTIARGSSFRIAGSVAPAHARKKVYLQRYAARTWRTISSTYLSKNSTYAFRVTPRATLSYRVYKTGDADHTWGASRARRVIVR